MRVGLGADAHALVEGVPLVLGGVEVESERGLAGHSDGDVISHALIDAVLGAAGLGDIGSLFPSDAAEWEGAELARPARARLRAGARGGLGARERRLRPRRRGAADRAAARAMQARLAEALGVEPGLVTVRATTTDSSVSPAAARASPRSPSHCSARPETERSRGPVPLADRKQRKGETGCPRRSFWRRRSLSRRPSSSQRRRQITVAAETTTATGTAARSCEPTSWGASRAIRPSTESTAGGVPWDGGARASLDSRGRFELRVRGLVITGTGDAGPGDLRLGVALLCPRLGSDAGVHDRLGAAVAPTGTRGSGRT